MSAYSGMMDSTALGEIGPGHHEYEDLYYNRADFANIYFVR